MLSLLLCLWCDIARHAVGTFTGRGRRSGYMKKLFISAIFDNTYRYEMKGAENHRFCDRFYVKYGRNIKMTTFVCVMRITYLLVKWVYSVVDNKRSP